MNQPIAVVLCILVALSASSCDKKGDATKESEEKASTEEQASTEEKTPKEESPTDEPSDQEKGSPPLAPPTEEEGTPPSEKEPAQVPAPDISSEEVAAPCVPSCEGRQCGDDGCGGSCGDCPEGKSCNEEGICACMPQCKEKHCGDDDCGGSCGDCPEGHACESGVCICVPDCSKDAYGPDGCGGICKPTCEVKVPDGKLHGEPCQSNEECKYGYCVSSPLITGGALKICTKPSFGKECICSTDNTAAAKYYPFRPGSPDVKNEYLKAFCLPYCYTTKECKLIDPIYTACTIPGNYGTTKFCVVK